MQTKKYLVFLVVLVIGVIIGSFLKNSNLNSPGQNAMALLSPTVQESTALPTDSSKIKIINLSTVAKTILQQKNDGVKEINLNDIILKQTGQIYPPTKQMNDWVWVTCSQWEGDQYASGWIDPSEWNEIYPGIYTSGNWLCFAGGTPGWVGIRQISPSVLSPNELLNQ